MVQIMGWNIDVNLRDLRNKKRVALLLQQLEIRDRRIIKLTNECTALDIDLQASREVNAKLQEEIATYKARELAKKPVTEVNSEEPVKRTRKKPVSSKA